MLTFDEAQVMAWFSPILWPFLRVLALFSVAPVFSMRVIPVRVKVGLAFLVALCAQATLEGQPFVGFNDREAAAVVVQQVLVGLAMGFTIRLVFAAVELAGEVIGLQMGLNFASFFDPASNTQLSAVGRFFGHMATLFFVSINGHLLLLMAVVESFKRFPVSPLFLEAIGQMRVYQLGAALFSSALWIALPMIALLLFVNLTLGIISRIAPQMNVYAVGFAVTLTVGLLGMTAMLPFMEQPIMTLMQQALDLFGRAS